MQAKHLFTEPIECHTKTTPWNDSGSGKVQYLDRHRVDCGNGHTIASFKLERNPPRLNKYRYTYKCCNTPFNCNSVSKHTNYNIKKDRGAVYLDRHRVSCSDQYLSTFQLDHSLVSYEYQPFLHNQVP